MKKNTIKHIAVGLLLAGYASSSAWAVIATTQSSIQGQKPIVKSTKEGAKPHTVTFNTQKADGTAHTNKDYLTVGDILILSYVLSDTDGDIEGDKDNTAASIYFYYSLTGKVEDWTAFPESSLISRTPATQANSKGEVKFRVPKEAEGAKYIGYKILEKTQYGFPAGDQWYPVPDAFNTEIKDLGEGKPTDPGDEIGNPEDPDGGGGDIETPINPPNPDCKPETDPDCKPGVQPEVGTRGAIYAVINGAVDTAVDFSKDATAFPIVEGTYTTYIYDKDDKDITGEYTKYQWKLVGNNGDAIAPLPGQEANIAITGATAREYKIGVNSAFPDYKAGAQGFNLQVDASIK